MQPPSPPVEAIPPSDPPPSPPPSIHERPPTTPDLRDLAANPPHTHTRNRYNPKLVTHDARLNQSAHLLHAWLQTQAYTVPQVTIHITGTHLAGDNTTTDFDFRCELTPTILIPNWSGSLIAVPSSSTPPDLSLTPLSACQDYTRSRRPLKTFRMRRTLQGMNSMLLKQQIRGMVATTGYNCGVALDIRITPTAVVVAPQNWVCRARQNGFWWGLMRWIGFLTGLWVLWLPFVYFAWREWDVVGASYRTRKGAEEEWAKRWRELVIDAVRTRKCRVLFTEEDLARFEDGGS